jgi:hypothetical protein
VARFHVALFCVDQSAIVYHVETYSELVQSLHDLAPCPAWLDAVGIAQGGHQRSGTFTARALEVAGLPRTLALAPMDGATPVYPQDAVLVAGQPVLRLDELLR